MATIHDSGYKRLFSNRTIFRQLMESFVKEAWVKQVDFATAETVDKSFVSARYQESESDLIYKVQFHGRELYIYILLEFQSTVDPFMALRVLNYVTSFYMDYHDSHKQVKKLPPIFPIVLYNGDRAWNAATNISD
ncbi:MAG: Rpn family recombination-promoting nuclease/putative transposase [Caldilineaceae bacterium]